MAGLYIHIPYCKSLCVYCDFHSCIPDSNLDSMIEVLCLEMTKRKSYLDNEPITTIYFGGGTPSLCSPDQLARLLSTAASLWNIKNCTEITVEANPDDLNLDYLKALRDLGINRLSIGTQSFDDQTLRFLRRRHNASSAIDSVRLAREAGFDNISIDLIYGIPEMSMQVWSQTLEQAIELGVEHISAYHLTVEQGTPLDELVSGGKVALVDEATSQSQFEMLGSRLEQAGILQYEISNFARKGFESQHNSSYWHGIYYIGIGPGAHSFDGRSRSWNLPDNRLYLEHAGEACSCQVETLTETMVYNEYIMTALRTVAGVCYKDLEKALGAHKLQVFRESSKKLIEQGLLGVSEYNCFIPKSNLMISDMVISELFVD